MRKRSVKVGIELSVGQRPSESSDSKSEDRAQTLYDGARAALTGVFRQQAAEHVHLNVIEVTGHAAAGTPGVPRG